VKCTGDYVEMSVTDGKYIVDIWCGNVNGF
jgi:hypothetical protein